MALDEPALEDYKQRLTSADATLLDRLVDETHLPPALLCLRCHAAEGNKDKDFNG